MAAASTKTAAGLRASTTSGTLALRIGMTEPMWTPAQVKAKHPKTGEVMLMGSMGGGMPMGGTQRHLEVDVYSRSTGKRRERQPDD